MNRSHAGVLLLTLLVVSTGCVGFLTGEESLVFKASAAEVGDSALQDAGFEEQQSKAIGVNRTISVQGQERSLSITNHLAIYGKSGEEVPLSTFAVFSTPTAEVLGQGVNPIGRLPMNELLSQVIQQSNADVNDVSKTGTRTITMLGSETELHQFSATAVRNDQEIDVVVRAARVNHEGDYVIAVGITPQDASNDDGALETMIGGIEHPV